MPSYLAIETGSLFLLENGSGYLMLERGLTNRQQIIDAAMQIAGGVGGDVQLSPVADAEMTAEDLFPLAVRLAAEQLLRSGNEQDVARSFSIRLTETSDWFVGTLPDEILHDYLDHAFEPDFPFSSKAPSFQDFQRHKFTNLVSYWAVQNGQYYTTSPASGATTIDLFAPGLPTFEDDPDHELEINPRFRDQIITVLAMAIRSEIKLGGS